MGYSSIHSKTFYLPDKKQTCVGNEKSIEKEVCTCCEVFCGHAHQERRQKNFQGAIRIDAVLSTKNGRILEIWEV